MAVIAALIMSACAGKVFVHKWDTVADVMAMHGKVSSFDPLPSEQTNKFVAENYRMVTTGGSCHKDNRTLEDNTLALVRGIKTYNPQLLVGMYWRTDMALEVAECTKGTEEWNSHPEWRLKDDSGKPVLKNRNFLFDYSNTNFSKFFSDLLVNIMQEKMNGSNQPVLNYLYLDGPDADSTAYAPGIGPQRSAILASSKMKFLSELQVRLDALKNGQNLILNGVDKMETAATFAPLGVAGVMVDHWTILQFLIRGQASGNSQGQFNKTAMNQLFDLVQSDLLSNMTIQIKGWPGPIIKQKDQYPPNMVTPTTPDEKQRIAGERFNSELAFFLLVAEEAMFWEYSWFWGFDDYVPNLPDSTVPANFFPQAKCALGPPLGPPKQHGQTFTYTREFQYASVFVDLNNRTNSHVQFSGQC